MSANRGNGHVALRINRSPLPISSAECHARRKRGRRATSKKRERRYALVMVIRRPLGNRRGKVETKFRNYVIAADEHESRHRRVGYQWLARASRMSYRAHQ